jgi:hypothetical protein
LREIYEGTSDFIDFVLLNISAVENNPAISTVTEPVKDFQESTLACA